MENVLTNKPETDFQRIVQILVDDAIDIMPGSLLEDAAKLEIDVPGKSIKKTITNSVVGFKIKIKDNAKKVEQELSCYIKKTK